MVVVVVGGGGGGSMLLAVFVLFSLSFFCWLFSVVCFVCLFVS